MIQEKLRGIVVDIYQTGYSRKNGEQQANDYVKERIDAITKLFLESLPDIEELSDFLHNKMDELNNDDDFITPFYIRLAKAITDQITKRWRCQT
jgi:L-ribulose-5-phosphate 3-epimerase UlaE